MSNHRLSIVRAVVAFTAAAIATSAYAADPLTVDDFRSATTAGIVKLCSAPESDPLHQAAVGYCVGYLTGAFHYYRVVEDLGHQPKLVCFGEAEPSRREEIARFVEWTKSHPQYDEAPAVDTMFRFLGEQYPCP